MTTQAIQPGIYPGMSFDDYLAIDAESNTKLGLVERSPAHYRAAVELERCKPLVIGQLVHCGQLEPLALAERYAVMPDFHLMPENSTAAGRTSTSRMTLFVEAREAEFIHANRDKEVVTREWFAEAMGIVAALSQCEAARTILGEEGPVELTLVWVDDETGLLCKARIDKLMPQLAAFADLKTCAALDSFQRSIASYGYHRQCAHYQAGWAKLTGELLTPWIVAVEKQRPYCSQAAPLDEEALTRGEERRRAALDLIAECKESNNWPGPPSPPSWRVPEWELNAGEPLSLIVNGEAVEV